MPHIHEKIDFCVDTYIVFNNKVLLRQHDKYKIWLAVGGHIELDENPNQAALKEVREEVGLEVNLFQEEGKQPKFNTTSNKSLIPPQFLNQHRINENHEHISLVYFATSNTDQLILSETEVSAGCKWFSKEDLLKNEEGIRDDIIFYALKALEKVSA